MSKSTYQQVLQRRYGEAKKTTPVIFISKILEGILALPHPERESAFVRWAQGDSYETPIQLVGDSNTSHINQGNLL